MLAPLFVSSFLLKSDWTRHEESARKWVQCISEDSTLLRPLSAEAVQRAFKYFDQGACGVVWCGVVWCGVVIFYNKTIFYNILSEYINQSMALTPLDTPTPLSLIISLSLTLYLFLTLSDGDGRITLEDLERGCVRLGIAIREGGLRGHKNKNTHTGGHTHTTPYRTVP